MRLERPLSAPASSNTDILDLSLTKHEILGLAYRALTADPSCTTDTFGKTVLRIGIDASEAASATGLSERERIYLLDEIVQLAKAELRRLDPTGNIALSNIAEIDQIRGHMHPKRLGQ